MSYLDEYKDRDVFLAVVREHQEYSACGRSPNAMLHAFINTTVTYQRTGWYRYWGWENEEKRLSESEPPPVFKKATGPLKSPTYRMYFDFT